MKRKSIFTTLAIALMFALSILGLTACGEKPVSYSITVTNGTANKVTAVSGDSVTITANEIDGQIFNEWIIVGFDTTDLDLTQNVLTFTMPANEVTATAVFENVYEMELENCTSDKEVARHGEPVTFTAGEYEGKRFTGWNIKGVDTTGLDLTKSPLTINMPANDIVVAAQYEDIYKITIGHGCTTDKEWAAEGEQVTVTKPAPETGFATRWQTTGIVEELNNSQHTVTFKMPANNIVINYINVRLNFSFVINNGTASGLKFKKVESVTDGSTGFDYNCDVTITANTPEIGKEFAGWTITGIDTSGLDLDASELTFKMPTNEVIATANYKNVNYTVIVNGGTANVTSAHYGDTVTITANVPTGKDFVMWSFEGFAPDDLTITNPELTFTMPAKNITVTANYEDINYSVSVTGGTAKVNDGGSYYTLNAHYGDNVTLTAIVPNGMRFVKWTSDNAEVKFNDATSATTFFVMPAENVTITAEFMLVFEGDTAKVENLRYFSEQTKSFKIQLGNGQDECNYSFAFNGFAESFVVSVYDSLGGEIFTNAEDSSSKSFTVTRGDIYTINIFNKAETDITATFTIQKI